MSAVTGNSELRSAQAGTPPVGQKRRKPRQQELQPSPASAFVTCKISQPLVDTLISQLTPIGCASIYFSERTPQGRDRLEAMMKTRNAWDQNLANLKNQVESTTKKFNSPVPATDPPKSKPTKLRAISANCASTPNRKGILKPSNVRSTAPTSTFARHEPARIRLRTQNVSLNTEYPTIHHYDQDLDDANTISGSIDDTPQHLFVDKGVVDLGNEDDMSQGQRPSLKLKLSTSNFTNTPPAQPTPNGAQTPNAQSAVRTPSIKLNFGKKPSISAGTPPIKIEPNEATPASGKKRKRAKADNASEDELSLSKPPPPQRRLTLKTTSVPAKTPVTPGPIFKLKTKGKIPKRPLGVGYDSELEDREIDPVLLEGFILRMPPGPDCDYVQAAIRDGTIGVHRAQGGADIRIRCLDTNGRRGIMIVNGHQYATTVVDLPCIIEGMKSWDKKGWIKSIDICQMMLVLGTCTSDEEAKTYPLPSDVDPKTHTYAHGLTAPMRWVRKRRFARTRRARVDDIESIERKVNALLEADAKALSSRFQIFDHDPRIEQDQYSEVEDDYDDEDAEGEEDDSYFPRQPGLVVETPVAMEMDAHVDQDQIDDIEAMFNEDDEEAATPAVNGHTLPHSLNTTLRPPAVRDSSVAVTSASGSPSASAVVTAAATPAEGQPASSDDEDDDDEDASDRSDSEKDADDNLQQVKDRIVDMENKIREQTELLKKTQNAILKKKLARKIGELRDDVRMMKVQNGLAPEEDGEDGDE